MDEFAGTVFGGIVSVAFGILIMNGFIWKLMGI